MTALWPRWYRPFAVRPLERPAAISIAKIQDAICERFCISLKDMLGDNKERAIAWPRQLGYLLCRESRYSLPRIGQAFQRDHSTIGSGIFNAKMRVAEDVAWASHYRAIKGALGL